jgi:biofilm PGA synthesis N-glycosyltransferase PgaC
LHTGVEKFYLFTITIQIVFYFIAFLGSLLKDYKIRLKFLFIPYYLFVMNYSIIVGMIRFFTRKQTAIWEKAKRK